MNKEFVFDLSFKLLWGQVFLAVCRVYHLHKSETYQFLNYLNTVPFRKLVRRATQLSALKIGGQTFYLFPIRHVLKISLRLESATNQQNLRKDMRTMFAHRHFQDGGPFEAGISQTLFVKFRHWKQEEEKESAQNDFPTSDFYYC